MQELPRFVRVPETSVTSSIDSLRIRELFENAIAVIRDILVNPNFGTSLDSANTMLDAVLKAQVAPPTLTLPLYNDKVNDLLLVIDVRKRKLSVVSSRSPQNRAKINSVLRVVNHG
jgi:hypothetical protein